MKQYKGYIESDPMNEITEYLTTQLIKTMNQKILDYVKSSFKIKR